MTDDAMALADKIAEILSEGLLPVLTVGEFKAIEAALRRTAPVTGRDREALEKIIEIDQHESKITVECDSAGNTYEIRSLDGPCATLARALLDALALPAGDRDLRSSEGGSVHD